MAGSISSTPGWRLASRQVIAAPGTEAGTGYAAEGAGSTTIADARTSLSGHGGLPAHRWPGTNLAAAAGDASQNAWPASLRVHHATNATNAASQASATTWGWLPALSLTGACGLLLIAVADTAARNQDGRAEPLFWIGLLALFVPAAVRLLSAEPSRRERIGLVLLVGLGLYLLKVFQYPLAFTFHDELGHLRGVDNLLQSGHLFDANPLNRMYGLYPAVLIVTDALVLLGGMTIFHAGVAAIGVARIVLVLGLYLFYEQVGWSPRIAGIATLLYMANTNFVFFLSQYAYESFTIPLAVLTLFAAVRWDRDHGARRAGLGWIVSLLLVSVVVGHHLTSYALVAVFLGWAAAGRAIFRRRARRRPGPGRLAMLGAFAVSVWILLAARSTLGYILPVLTRAVSSFVRFATSESGANKEIFRSGTGHSPPLLERVIGFGSVGLILLGLPFGLWAVWRRYRARPIAVVLGGAAIAYPATLALRLTQAGTETAERSSEFLFLGIAFILSLAITDGSLPGLGWVRPLLAALVPASGRALVLAGYVTVIFAGGIIVGWSSSARLPGPYIVAADQQSIEPQGVAASIWAREHLGPGNRIATDRTNAMLMGSYGRQEPQFGTLHGRPIPSLFFSTEFGAAEQAIIDDNGLRYLVVDRRLSRSLPSTGVYFERTEPGAYQHTVPIAPEALAKFDDEPGLSRVFDSGDIIIYGVRRRPQAPERAADRSLVIGRLWMEGRR